MSRVAAIVCSLLVAGCARAARPHIGSLGSSKLRVADVAIDEAVERELASESAVPAEALEVAVESGVVTLEGTLPDLLAHERALRQTEAVRAVRSVVDLVEVEPPSRPDAELLIDVRAELADDPALADVPIEVSVEGAEATLHGQVHSAHQRRLAQLVASGVVGLRSVRDELEVELAEPRPDEQLAEEIGARLHWDALVHGELVEVEVENGEVTLRGTVGSAAEKRRVMWDAWVPGVEEVDGERLAVAWWARDVGNHGMFERPADRDIEHAILAAFRQDPRIPAYGGTVRVRDGVVALAGMVGSLRAKQAAGADAASTVGVREVHNRIEVRATNEAADVTVQRLERALARHPRMVAQRITAAVDDGVARLTGDVALRVQRIVAEQVAARTLGVQSVRNELQVREPSLIPNYDPYSLSAYPYDPPRRHELHDSGAASLSDREIHARIHGELLWNPLVDATRIEVTVKAAVAVLEGRVDSRVAQQAAVIEAYQGGALAVDSQLRIGE